VNWVSLAESAGFVCASVVMMAVLTAAQRSVNRQLAGTGPAGPQVGQSQAGAAAVVLGLVARRKVHASGARGGLAALAGLSLGYVAAVDTVASEIIRWL